MFRKSDEYITVEEAAHKLRISRDAAYKGIKSGDIPSVMVGATIRVPTVCKMRSGAQEATALG